MKYLINPVSLGPTALMLADRLARIQAATEPPAEAKVEVPAHPRPSPSKLFSNRGKRRLGVVAAERKAKRRRQKAARRRNRAGR